MKSRRARVLIHVAAMALGLFIVGPLVVTILAGLLPEVALRSFPPNWFQYGLTLDHYTYIFTGVTPQSYITHGQLRSMTSQEVRTVPQAALNSAMIAGSVMFINLILGSLAAFAFAKLRFPGRTPAFFFITMSRLIPAVGLAVPYYAIVQSLGLLDTLGSLILIHSVLTLPFTILILTLYFRNVPVEIEESAQLDGCGPFETMARVTLPLALPSLVGVGLFAFMLSYSEFLFGLLITTSMNSRTVSVLLGALSTNTDVSWALLNATITISLIPTLLLIGPVWKYMVAGLTSGWGTGQ